MSDGYAISSLDEMGQGYGFRKIRHAVGITAFGMNAIVFPPGFATGVHYHDEQEETYLVHQGTVEFRFPQPDGDDVTHTITTGGVVRIDSATHRGMRNIGDDDAVVVVIGGKDGYVGRDGRTADGATGDGPPGAAH